MQPEILELKPDTDAVESDQRKEYAYIMQFKLEPHVPVHISMDSPIGAADQVFNEIGLNAPLIAGIHAAGVEYAIFDTTENANTNVPALITGEGFHLDEESHTRFKGIRAGEKVIIGRNHHGDRFDYPETVSGDHFSVQLDLLNKQVIVEDLDSSNGTYVSGFLRHEDIGDLVWSEHTRTMRTFVLKSLAKRYGEQDSGAPYGYYRNHPIIGRNSPTVRDGVYGTSNSEMVLVDDKSDTLRRVTDQYIESIQGDGNATFSVKAILLAARHHVERVLTYDLDRVERLSEPHYESNGIIDLSEYVEQGVGVCRHQALLAAHLIEEAIERGYMTGTVGVERNADLELKGAHAWAVYKSAGMDDVIIDPAQHFVGTRDEAEKTGRWKYRLSRVSAK